MNELKENIAPDVEMREVSAEATSVALARSPQLLTKQMVLLSCYVGLAGWIFNFDIAYGGTVLQMQSYKKSFGRCIDRTDPETGVTAAVCSQTPLQQSLVSVTFIFVALGGALSGVTGRYLGRRGTIQAGALLAAVGAGGMLGTAGSFTSYMICKCIGAVGLGHLIAAAPVYGVECAIASKRGMLLALFNIGLSLGNSAAAATCWGSSTYLKSNLAWQIPIICQIPMSFILGFGVYLFPESPRWLLTKGREEAAKRSFAWFYAKSPDHPDILLQVQDVISHIELEKSIVATTNWTEIYRGVNLRRTFISGLIMVGLAITGSKFFQPYGAIFLAQVGIKNPFLNNFIQSICVLAGAIPGPLVVEYGGRRFSLLWGFSTMTVCMLTIGVVGSVMGQSSVTAKIVLLVFLFTWCFFFGLFIATSVWIAAPEQHSLRLRTYGQASTTAVYQIFGFASSYYGPYMLSSRYGNMGLNVGYFYAGVTFMMLILVFLLVPETALLTLEQIDDHYFSGRTAWRTSTSRNKKISRGKEAPH